MALLAANLDTDIHKTPRYEYVMDEKENTWNGQVTTFYANDLSDNSSTNDFSDNSFIFGMERIKSMYEYLQFDNFSLEDVQKRFNSALQTIRSQFRKEEIFAELSSEEDITFTIKGDWFQISITEHLDDEDFIASVFDNRKLIASISGNKSYVLEQAKEKVE